MRKNINIMIKPASSLCNLNCQYCFYHDTAELRSVASYGLMTQDTASSIIAKSLAFAEGGDVNFVFQGGEPLLWGIDNYIAFFDTVSSTNNTNSKVTYAVQTNGTLLTEQYCQLFALHNVLVGVSIDGRSQLHNMHRLDNNGKGTYNAVMHGVKLLQKYDVQFNALVVVTKASSRCAKSIYNFFKSQGIDYLQFITCLEPMGAELFSSKYALTNGEYFTFYRDMFDEYYRDKCSGSSVHINYFDNVVAMIMQGTMPNMCGMFGYCTGQIVIESNGNIYPCDFYCLDKHLLGNISNISFEQAYQSPAMTHFIEGSRAVDMQCTGCDVANICRGGCRRERDYMDNGQLQLNIYCEGRYQLLHHIINKLQGDI